MSNCKTHQQKRFDRNSLAKQGRLIINIRQPRYSKEEFARRGTELYERDIRQRVEIDNKGKIIAIDIEIGDYAIGEDILSASQQIFDRNDDAQIWSVRVGCRAVSHFGSCYPPVNAKM